MEDRSQNDGSTLEAIGLARTFKEVVHEEHGEGKEVNWKSFKDGIRIHSAGNAWAAAVAESANGRPRAGALSRTSSMRVPQSNPGPGGFNARDGEQDEAVAALLQQRPPPAKGQPAVKMSLMALLADSGGYSDGDEDEEEEDYVGAVVAAQGGGDAGGKDGGGEMASECCVCMVRHKGGGFIPCGHTFCRLCSRELSVSRGNCPLCSSFVLEILDIF
ncbi:hypothetical protein KSP39_PZI006787 [Platanthera zijinensis]|uniref:RING-type domain-containing protein n=1 Tax=Platanthera zijinensis TaxID=2320716 RepID=A0AAP0G9C0_9ASPA